MRYDFTMPTEDPKAWRKKKKRLRTVAYIRYYRVHMQTCQPEQPEIKYWFCAVNLKTCSMEISSETRFKIFCSKKVQTSIKENNLRTKEGRLNILHEKKKNLLKGKEIKLLSFLSFLMKTRVSEQPVLLGGSLTNAIP